MKIELKNVQINQQLSEETTCFSATIYIDGVKEGFATNRGHGDATCIHAAVPTNTIALIARIEEYAKTLPMWECNGRMVSQDAELAIGKLLDDFLLERDLRRILAKRVTFTVPNEKGIFRLKKEYRSKAELLEVLAAPDLKERINADKILNLLPFNQAVAIYKEEA